MHNYRRLQMNWKDFSAILIQYFAFHFILLFINIVLVTTHFLSAEDRIH